MANSKPTKKSTQLTAPMVLVVNQSGDNKKPFYRNVGQAFFDETGIVVHVLPCVVITGGLLRVVNGVQMMDGLQDRLDIKVVTLDGDEKVYHSVGTAFKVKDKEGMYTLSVPNAGLYGSFVLQNPAPKQDK